jgi:hypothetical protein
MEAADALRKELVALAAIRDSLVKENEQVRRRRQAGACYLVPLTRLNTAAEPAARVRGRRASGAWACHQVREYLVLLSASVVGNELMRPVS